MDLIGIWAYMVTLYIRPQDWAPLFLNDPVNDVIIAGTLLAALPKVLSPDRRMYVPQYLFLAAFLALVFLSNAVNGNTSPGFEVFINYLKRAAVFVMFIFVVDSAKRIRWVLFAMVVLSTLLAIQGIEQARTGVGWAGQPLMRGYEDIRIVWIGDWDGPNVLALLFVLALAITLEFGLGPYPVWFRLLNTVCAVILLYGVYLTNSRGGILSLLAVVLFYCGRRFGKTYAAVVCVLLSVLVFSYAPSRMAELSPDESSAHERRWVWEQGLTLLREHPLLGVGKGQFTKYSYNRLQAHNNYIQVSAEVGLLGFFCWLGLFYLSMKGLSQIERQASETEEQARIISLARALSVAMVAFSVVTFFVTMELDILFVLWALGIAVFLVGREAFPAMELSVSRRDVVGIAGAMGGILALVFVATTL